MKSKNQKIEDDDDMPELEDLSEELGKIRQKLNKEEESSEIKLNVINNSSQNTKSQNINIPIQSGDLSPTPTPNTTPNTMATVNKQPPQKQEESGFRFKKGFFLRNQEIEKNQNNNSNNNTNNNKKEEETNNKIIDLTHVKSSGETVKEKFISQVKTEVKENANSNDLGKSLNYLNEKKDEWCNTNLLNMIAQRPNLMKFFMDPRFADAIQLMQKDPKKFMEIYGKNPDFNEFIKEFSFIMSNHFNKIGEEKQASQPPMDKEVEKIISEPKVKMIIERLQREGKLDVNEIQRDPELSMKIKLLIDKGFLKLQRE